MHKTIPRREGWRFVMLNTNEVASCANVVGTPPAGKPEELMEQIRKTGRENGAGYNGGVSKKQLEWLKNELETAEHKKEKVIVFSHHPLYAAPGLTALNDREIPAVLAAYPCVKAGISGHHHPGDFGFHEDIPFITTEGMIETEKENAYAIVEITADRIVLNGKGRTTSHTLPIR
jgi:manganese-dependent ADP-ribose/CDP-alcohol diphosphatase